MVTYGGDEVAALVVDIGSSSLRAGYAGDDSPKAIIPTSYGYIKSENTDVAMDGTGAPSSDTKMFIGQSGPSLWREGMEVSNPIYDGLIQDFNPIPQLINHAISDVMRCSPAEHPVLVTEPPWNTPANRERMAEIMFEEFKVPAFYIANTGVLNAFAAGKGSALVIDIGENVAAVTPVVDGFVLRKGLSYSSLPRFIRSMAKHNLLASTHSRPAVQLLNHQLISNKQPVEPNAPPKFTLREDRMKGTTESWKAWYETREVDEWIQSVGGILDQGWNDQAAHNRPPRQYEFATGFNTYFGADRLQLGEQYFWQNPQTTTREPSPPKVLPRLIAEALGACDPELRQMLAQNVALTGGGTLFSGLSDRLNVEMQRQYHQVKIHAPGNPTERRYGGWLGGSILASLGTFHQLWISKEEWQEHGKAIVGQRCK